MKPKILKALDASIEEWCKRRADVNYEWGDCAMCQAHRKCTGCPLDSCLSLFDAACDAHDYYLTYRNSKKAKADWKRKATNMIRYMRRRLPG